MPKATKTPRMKRTQISLPADEFEAIQKVAARRNVSMSSVIRSAVHRELDDEQAIREKMLSIVGIIKGGDPDASEKHDEILYE